MFNACSIDESKSMISSGFASTSNPVWISILLLSLTNLTCPTSVIVSGQQEEGQQNQKQHVPAFFKQETTQDVKQESKKADDQRSLGSAPTSVEEARVRARLLHEAFGGALQVMHRDYFREDQRLKLPSKSLEDVFKEMATTHQVELRWLAVNANAMSVDHKPRNEFEEQAVKALSSGKDEFELANEKSFQYAGSIPLSASCVKCHVRSRTSNAEKKAALVIIVPLRKKQ
jgi:hypothetical protein